MKFSIVTASFNADDYLLPGALARVATFADSHPEADAIYVGFDFVDGEKRRLKTSRSFPVSRIATKVGNPLGR